MQHIGILLAHQRGDFLAGGGVPEPRQPAHRNAGHAEQQMPGHVGEPRLAERVGRRGIEDEADVVAPRGLFGGEVEDVSKQPADGRTQDMQDAKACGQDGGPSDAQRIRS